MTPASRLRWRRLHWALALPALALGAMLATGPDSAAETGCPSTNRPNMLTIVAGSPQTAQLQKLFQTNLQVALANSNGCPLTGQLAGISVHFTAPAGGASGTFAASGTNSIAVGTDANGVATAPMFTANAIAGSYSVRADSDYGSVELSLTNTASGVPASISAAGQTDQEATANSRYSHPLQAQVLDANGLPVQGVSVTFALVSGPTGAGAGFLDGGNQASATTDGNGQAVSPPFVANSIPGRFTATATITGKDPVGYRLRNLAGTLTAVGAAQTATVGTRYPRPLRARVLDAEGRPLDGVTVTFTLPQAESAPGAGFVGGGNQASATTDVNGQAVSPRFVANGTAGRFTATAAITGRDPVGYGLRNLAGRLTAVGAAQTATVGSRYPRPLRARVLDAEGRPLDGVTVTFTLPQAESAPGAGFVGGGNQASATTGANGQAVSPRFVANGTPGRFTATATITGGKPVSYELENRAGRAAKVTAGAGSGQSTTTGSRFPIPLAVTVSDADDNPVSGALVVFTAPASGPGGFFTSHPRGRPQTTSKSRTVRVKTNANGVAVAPPFTANGRPGGYVVTARVAGSRQSAAFALVNRPRR